MLQITPSRLATAFTRRSLASFVLEAVLEGTLDCVESVCERVLAEVTGIAHDKAYTPHQRYLPVFQLVKQRYRDFAELFDRCVDPPLDHKRLFFI